jgi:hypothetical protein
MHDFVCRDLSYKRKKVGMSTSSGAKGVMTLLLYQVFSVLLLVVKYRLLEYCGRRLSKVIETGIIATFMTDNILYVHLHSRTYMH